jgi:hypothetical protein
VSVTDLDGADVTRYRSFCTALARADFEPRETRALAHRLAGDPPRDALVELLIVACRVIVAAYGQLEAQAWIEPARRVIVGLGRQRLEVPPGAMVQLLGLSVAFGPGNEQFLPKSTLLGFVSSPIDRAVREALIAMRDVERGSTYADARRLVARLDDLLGDAPGPLDPGGPWSTRVLDDIAAFDPAARDAWRALVTHLGGAKTTEPTSRWASELVPYLDPIGRPSFVERTLAWFASGPTPGGVRVGARHHPRCERVARAGRSRRVVPPQGAQPRRRERARRPGLHSRAGPAASPRSGDRTGAVARAQSAIRPR